MTQDDLDTLKKAFHVSSVVELMEGAEIVVMTSGRKHNLDRNIGVSYTAYRAWINHKTSTMYVSEAYKFVTDVGISR